MNYIKGHIGRMFVLHFNDNDILLKEFDKFAKKERINAAVIHLLGALKDGDLVIGPKKAVVPSKPNWVKFKDGWEVLGFGTIFSGDKGPQVHIHTTMGKKTKTLCGCVRRDSKVFLRVEAVVFELKGVRTKKEIDPKTGLNFLNII
ncbi:MAG: DUF296 domain-containing protein [Candidatus Omnitrophota bacterium]|nr:DUF296 domain-containing protein [Candidatus Omnitrophota bacterium]